MRLNNEIKKKFQQNLKKISKETDEKVKKKKRKKVKKKLDKIAKDTNFYLKRFINKSSNSKLVLAMKYGLFPGGKKLDQKF